MMTNPLKLAPLKLKPGDSVRQGDVLLVRRARRFGHQLTPRPREDGGVVLAHGEHTGHRHMLHGPQTTLFRDGLGHSFLEVKAPDALVHEEHTAHVFPAGFFEQGIQVEHEPADIRIVAD
jgi:hypothetical protein